MDGSGTRVEDVEVVVAWVEEVEVVPDAMRRSAISVCVSARSQNAR